MTVPTPSGEPVSGASLNLVVAIATAGRRDVLSSMLAHLAGQSRLPDRLYVCPARPDDVDVAALAAFPGPTQIVHNGRGLCRQRNAIVRAATDADVMVFFDDDFLPQPSYLAEAEALFLRKHDLVVATGAVLADGAVGPGLSLAEGLAALAADRLPQNVDELLPAYSGYGCNMAIRLDAARRHGIEFDENLPNYGWWEDVDFCRRLARFGDIVRSRRMRGVHLGTKTGRSPGKPLGYSQVANLVYMMRKGSVSPGKGLGRMGANILANVARSFAPEPWVDRRGRLIGNLEAIYDLIRGDITPLKFS